MVVRGRCRGKIHEGLRFNGRTGEVPHVVAHELECPLRDPSCGVAVADDVPEWVRSDDRDFVVGEVVQELLSHHQYSV